MVPKRLTVETPVVEEKPIDPRFRLPAHLKEWVEKNAKPKVLVFPPKKKRRRNYRFKRRGPMAPEDWKRFRRWYKLQLKIVEKNFQKTYKLALNLEKVKAKRRRRRKGEPRVMYIDWNRLDELAEPLWYTPKHEYIPEEDYPYSPQLHPLVPAKKGKARPFIQKQVPHCFKHPYLEMDFWFEYRFPINKDALKYKATKLIKKLAIPRKRPPDPHCPIPVNYEYIDPRIKMPYKRWVRHLRYLDYFASPKDKMWPRRYPFEYSRGPKKPLRELESRCNDLAQPKVRKTPKDNELGKVSEGAKKHNASARTKEISKPVDRKDNNDKKDPFSVAKGAKSATASARTKELAEPKKDISMPDNPPWSLKPNRPPKSKFSYLCPKREAECAEKTLEEDDKTKKKDKGKLNES